MTTTSRRAYSIAGLVLLFGMIGIMALPDQSLIVLSIGAPAMIIAAIVSVLYLTHVYDSQPVPRSLFFRMMLETFWALVVIGVWITYLSVARITERMHDAGDLDWNLPAPPPGTTSPLSALVIVVVFAGPVRFAIEVWQRRKRAGDPLPEKEDTYAGSGDH